MVENILIFSAGDCELVLPSEIAALLLFTERESR